MPIIVTPGTLLSQRHIMHGYTHGWRVTCGGQVINATLNPVWNESFLLYVRDLASDILKVGGSRSTRFHDEELRQGKGQGGCWHVACCTMRVSVCLPHAWVIPAIWKPINHMQRGSGWEGVLVLVFRESILGTPAWCTVLPQRLLAHHVPTT
jgi:hypothetical protein